MAEESVADTLDGRGLSRRELGDRLRAVESEQVLKLVHADTRQGFAAGVATEGAILVDGSVGDFALLLGEVASLEIGGDAGDGCGHSLVSGRVLVSGSAGNYLGAHAKGGFIVVHGHAQNRCGYALHGADVFVRSSVGDEAGCGMQSGVLVLGNGAGDNTGQGMTGGTLYVRGDVKSIAEGVTAIRMKDADSMRLSLLLARAGIKGGVKDFRVYRPKGRAK